MIAGAGVATGMIAAGLIGDVAEDTALGAILTQPAAVSVPLAFGTMVLLSLRERARNVARDDDRAARSRAGARIVFRRLPYRGHEVDPPHRRRAPLCSRRRPRTRRPTASTPATALTTGRSRCARSRHFEVPEQTMNHDDHCREPTAARCSSGRAGLTRRPQTGGWRLRAPSGTRSPQLRWSGGIAGVTGVGRAGRARHRPRRRRRRGRRTCGSDTRTFALPAGTTLVELRQVCRSAVCSGPGADDDPRADGDARRSRPADRLGRSTACPRRRTAPRS